MDDALNIRKFVLEYEKPGVPKMINNKYRLLSMDDPNDYIFVEKDELPSISDSFATQIIENEAISLEDEEVVENKYDPDIIVLKPDDLENDKRTIWDNDATRLLLSLYKKTEPLIGSKQIRNKRKMWENIAAEMNKSGFNYTNEQIENRFKTLIRAYRKTTQSESLFTKPQKNCLFQEEMDEIMLKDSSKFGGDSVEIHYEQDDSNQDIELEDDTADLFDIVNDSDVKKIDWDEKASKLLLKLYKKKKPFIEQRKFKNKKEMWENIAAEINKRNYVFTGSQVENRFKTLLRGYKKVLKEGGNRKKVFIYQDELDEIFLEDNDVFPEIISGVERRSLKKQILERLGMEVDEEDDDDNEYREDISANISNNVQTEEYSPSVLNVLKEIRDHLVKADKRAAERHSELVKLLKEANDIQRRKTNLIERFATLPRKT